MSETTHSPEPWRYDEDESPWPGGALVFDLNGTMSFDVSADDARRIVACVNACAGIPTDALESGALGKALDRLVSAMVRDPGVLGAEGNWIRGQVMDALRSLGRL